MSPLKWGHGFNIDNENQGTVHVGAKEFFPFADYIRLISGTFQMESNGEVVAMKDRELRFGNNCFNGARVSLF